VNKKALSLAVCLAVSYSSASYALGLGEIESSSHLNQPFRAKINLLSTSVADAKRLQVRVASPEVFSRVGIERPEYLNSVSFTPTVENGKPVIMVSSNKPINQPFLNFLIEVSWPNGQLLKEYTVLLDPPVLVQAGTAVANNTVGVRPEPKSQQQTQASVVKPKPQQATDKVAVAPTKQTIVARKNPAPARKATTKRKNRSGKYRVVRGDTLSKVAKKSRRKGVRNEQMMMALFRANPTAFRKRNINNLKAGALLRRPSARDARQLSYKQAKSAIYKQSRQWRSKLGRPPY
jgi:pilus assembly protein FimV